MPRLHQKRHHLPNIRYGRIPSHRLYSLPLYRTIYRLARPRFSGDIDEEDLLWVGHSRIVGWVYLVYPYAGKVQ
jgi:hypothetical protein